MAVVVDDTNNILGKVNTTRGLIDSSQCLPDASEFYSMFSQRLSDSSLRIDTYAFAHTIATVVRAWLQCANAYYLILSRLSSFKMIEVNSNTQV